jgi:hypothetical protein
MKNLADELIPPPKAGDTNAGPFVGLGPLLLPPTIRQVRVEIQSISNGCDSCSESKRGNGETVAPLVFPFNKSAYALRSKQPWKFGLVASVSVTGRLTSVP